MEGNEGKKNKSLQISYETKNPVRVIRGYKLESKFAPLGIDYGGGTFLKYCFGYHEIFIYNTNLTYITCTVS